MASKTTKKVSPKIAQRVKRTDAKYSTLRKSCSAGTIAIMLAGRFRGKRVVILKQLERNGPLVVSGPFKLNGVPLRRVDSRYLIATSTKIDISSVDTSNVTIDTFKRAAADKRVKGEGEFMGDKAKKVAEAKAKKTDKAAAGSSPNNGKVSNDRRALQKAVDAGIMAALKKDSLGKEKAGYLKSVFTVKPGDCPHRMNW